jgi:hypothetical protein
MAVSKQPNAIFLNNEPFSVRSYQRSVTDDLVARFGSSEKGDTNLDLLKVQPQKSLRGGMFQNNFSDPEKCSSITEGYYNSVDGAVYLTQSWSNSSDSAPMDTGTLKSWCYWHGDLYITFQTLTIPIQNVIQKFDLSTSAISTLTLPSVLANNTDSLRLFAFDDYIFVATRQTTSGGTISTTRRWDGTTFTDVSTFFTDFAEFNGVLYGISSDASFPGLYSVADPSATPIVVTRVATFGLRPPAGASTFYQGSINYNSALYIATQHGLYRWNGVTCDLVLNYKKSASYFNFTYLAVFNGRLYYTIKDKLYEFDGTNITLVQDFTDAYHITSLAGGADRLWIGTRNNSTFSYSNKFGSGVVYTHSVFAYNGLGFFEYHVFPNQVYFPYVPVTIIELKSSVFAIIPDITISGGGSPQNLTGYKIWENYLPLEFSFETGSLDRALVITSSVIDCDYSAVAKVINGVLNTYDGFNASESVLKLELQYFNNGAWSVFSEVWNSQNLGAAGISTDYLLHDQAKLASPNLSTVPAVFEKIRWRFTRTVLVPTTVTSLFRYFGSTLRYSIQPRMRFKWLLTLQLFGYDKAAQTTQHLSDGTLELRTSAYLRKIIYDSFKNKLPILFYDFDWTEIRSLSPLKVQGMNFISAGDFVAFQDQSAGAQPWINQKIATAVPDLANDFTTLTLASTGYRVGIGGSSNSTLAFGGQVRKSYAVYVKDIRNENYIVDPNTLNNSIGNQAYTDIPSLITVELIEV